MPRMIHRFLATASALTLIGLAACNDTTSSQLSAADLSAAFATVPFGYTESQNSFDGVAGAPDGPWMPSLERGDDRGRHDGPGGHGHGGLGGLLGLMGGGLGDDFLGGPGLGRGFGHGRHGDPALTGTCAYTASAGRVDCEAITFRGLTITRSAAYTTASGAAQSAFDSLTTNTVNTRVAIAGTFTRRDSSTSTLAGSSDRTVSGLAAGSTQRTVNGTSGGRETTTGTNRDGAQFTAVRDVADTVKGIVIPVQDTGRAYPTAGRVIRTMKVTLTIAGGSAQTSTRREVVTYDGSTTAKVEITQDGETKSCTIPLPHGRPNCS
jgi:hypothetical protein